MSRNGIGNRWTILTWVVVFALLLTACGGEPQAKTYTVGVVTFHVSVEQAVNGLKEGMAERGYTEGENITYIYSGPMANTEAAKKEIEGFVTQGVDAIFTVGTEATLLAKQAVEGTAIPVVFAPVVNPVQEGVVQSLDHPGGNVTGVQTGNTLPKALEWLLTLAPEVTRIYVPYSPNDAVSVTSITPLREAVSKLGVELVLGEVATAAEAITATAALQGDGWAVFYVPAPILAARIGDVINAATERGLPTGSYMSGHVQEGALVSYTSDFFPMGKQAAGLMEQVLQGANPADLPVETGEYSLNINLQTAAALGLDVSDGVLRQADVIIR